MTIELTGRIVDTVPCADCTAATDVTAFAMDVAKTMNRAARTRGIAPLRKSEIVLCKACYASNHTSRAASTRRALLRDIDLWNRYQRNSITSEALLQQVSDEDSYRSLVHRREAVASQSGRRSGRATDLDVFGGEGDHG